jgi:hypothetical protein
LQGLQAALQLAFGSRSKVGGDLGFGFGDGLD